MNRLVVLLALLLCLPLSARADEASKRVKVHEMFLLLHMDKRVDQLMDLMMKQVSSNSEKMFGKDLTPEEKAKLSHFQEQVFNLVETQVSWKALEPQYTDLYAQTYTEDELDAILAFYKSPAGVSMIAKTPELTTRSMELSQARMTTLMPQLRQMMEDFMREAAKSASTQPATGDTPKK
jgi:hypothetical protein